MTEEILTESPEQPAQEGADQAKPENTIPEVDSYERFKFSGQEWTPKDLQGAIMRMADYTRKTQELSTERKYYDNLQADLDYLEKNPNSLGKFKEIYPAKFHGVAEKILRRSGSEVGTQSKDNPEWMDRFTRLESEINEQKVQAINAELDAKFEKLSKKYPHADEEAVVARAQALISRGEKITDQVWDSLWKSVHDRMKGNFDKYYSGQVKSQKQANALGKDVAVGGGTPAQGPRQFKTIKEATNELLKQYENGG